MGCLAAASLSLVLALGLAGCNFQRQSQGNQPTAAQGQGSTPAIGATSETDTLGDEIDQGLRQLDNLNQSADTLDDQP